jgi:hypothetical protein
MAETKDKSRLIRVCGEPKAEICECPSPYLGCQPVGTPIRCERCGGLVKQAVAETKAGTLRDRVQKLWDKQPYGDNEPGLIEFGEICARTELQRQLVQIKPWLEHSRSCRWFATGECDCGLYAKLRELGEEVAG